jgi:hypothetical protein
VGLTLYGELYPLVVIKAEVVFEVDLEGEAEMKSSKVAKQTSRIGHLSLVTMMALVLSMGTVMAAPRTLELYKIGTSQTLSGFHEGSVNTSKNTEAVDLFKSSKVDFVKKYSELGAKSTSDAFAALILDKVKDKEASHKITREEMQSIREELAKKDLESSFGLNKEGGLKSAAALKLFDLMVAGDYTKQQIMEQEYYEIFQKDLSLVRDLDASLVKKEETRVAGPTAAPVDQGTGERGDDTEKDKDVSKPDYQKCADYLAEQSKPIWDMISKLGDQIKALANKKPSEKKKEDDQLFAQRPADDFAKSALDNLANRLGQQRDNNPPPQQNSGTPSGQQQSPQTPALANNDEPEAAKIPNPEEPPQIQSAPGEQVQTPTATLVPVQSAQPILDKVNTAVAKAKDPIAAGDAIKAAITQAEQKWMPLARNQQEAAAIKGAIVLQQKPAIDAAVAGMNSEIDSIEPTVNSLKSQIAQGKAAVDQQREQALLARADSATRAAYQQLKNNVAESEEKIASLEQRPDGQQALAQAQSEKKRYKKQMSDIDAQLAALDPAFQKAVQTNQQLYGDAEAKLQELAAQKSKLTAARNELVSLGGDTSIAGALAGAAQPQLTRGATLGGTQTSRPTGGRTVPSQLLPQGFTGSAPAQGGNQRMPLANGR